MINWQEQWEQFAPGFKEGVLPIDLQRFSPDHFPLVLSKVSLAPGPGFGDLSHPTTQLMLKNLYRIVPGQEVLDIGSGSGILSLASYALGAKSVAGIDIDPEAVEHAKSNVLLNGLQDKVQFHLSSPSFPDFQEGALLMNMITSEQEQAVAMLPRFKDVRGHFLLSGILKKQLAEVISTYALWGWSPLDVSTSYGWSLIHFRK